MNKTPKYNKQIFTQQTNNWIIDDLLAMMAGSSTGTVAAAEAACTTYEGSN
jgi:hypothetical protein